MTFSNRIYFIALFVIFLASCASPTTETGKTSAEKPNLELAKTPIHTIDFYSDSNKESMNDILSKTIDANKTPIFFFTASWCRPCKEFKASMKYDLVAKSLEDATMIIIDVDKDKESHAADYGVRSIPTFIIVDKEGNAINTITGAAWAENTPNNIGKAMDEFLGKEG